MENRKPLRVYCKNCGAPGRFDIVRQTYACASCGAQIVFGRVRFYSFGRWLQIALNIGLTVFLPAILAAFVRWIYMEPGETFGRGYRFLYGAAWYVLAGFMAVLYLVNFSKRSGVVVPRSVRAEEIDAATILMVDSSGFSFRFNTGESDKQVKR